LPRFVVDRVCPTLPRVSAIPREKAGVDRSDDAPASFALSYVTSGVCIDCSESDGDEAKMISANEPEFARAVALLLHEAALIDRYWITSSKHTTRIT
jgi:hypothetical protein